jgi:hypothetical protein
MKIVERALGEEDAFEDYTEEQKDVVYDHLENYIMMKLYPKYV